jgi:hypothetical protein
MRSTRRRPVVAAVAVTVAALAATAGVAGAQPAAAFDPSSCAIVSEGPAGAPVWAGLSCATGATALVLTGDPEADLHASEGRRVAEHVTVGALAHSSGPDGSRRLRLVLRHGPVERCIISRDLARAPETTTVACKHR